MSATNKTTYYDLPIFIGTDVPSWLGDWNDTMNGIDGAINSVKLLGESAKSTANSAENKSDANTVSIENILNELKTIKTAVQNYDSILNFEMQPTVITRSNVSGSCILVSNTNKTLHKLMIGVRFNKTFPNPIVYKYGNGNWFDLVTLEDNIFRLNQSSLPNAETCITIGVSAITYATTPHPQSYVRAWFDGVTTHIGINNNLAITQLTDGYITFNTTFFVSGSVYNPDNPDTPES